MYDTFKNLRGSKPPIGRADFPANYPIIYPKRPEGEQLRILRVVADRARDVADARLLIDALGILED
jgi:hypothetical protein